MVPPPGLVYVPDAISGELARSLEARFDALPWEQVVIRGGVAKRVVVHYGRSYTYDTRSIGNDAPPLPGFLDPLMDLASSIAGVPAADFAEALVSRYPVDAAIGWHKDAPAFERVAGFSFGSAATLKLRRNFRTHRELFEVELAPRSAYLLTGASRWLWQHSMPPAKSVRHSITLRTLYRPGQRSSATA